MILVKKVKVFHLLCLLKIDQEKVFADVLDKPLKTIKTSVYEKRKTSERYVKIGKNSVLNSLLMM